MTDPGQTQTEPTNPVQDQPQPQPNPPTTAPKWPGWPGDNVFRLIVPDSKVGTIIGRKGELVKKICDDTRARVRVLDAPIATPDRVVLITGKEDPNAPLSPAMDAVMRVFQRITGLGNGADKGSATDTSAFCSMRLLVASTQAINLIGKQGSTIKSIQENAGAVVRILTEELPSFVTSDERIVEIHGESSKVLKALEAVITHLRKFLHDHSVVTVFERTYNETISQDRIAPTSAGTTSSLAYTTTAQTLPSPDCLMSLKRDSYFGFETDLETKLGQSALSLYGSDSALGGLYSTGLSRAVAPIVTQITQTMQVPLSYAENIIGVGGRNIAYIRRTSGAVLTVQECQGRNDEIAVEIKGSTSQVQTAQQLIQESINSHQTASAASLYSKREVGLGASYSQLTETAYRSSYSNLGGGYSSGLGAYSSYKF